VVSELTCEPDVVGFELGGLIATGPQLGTSVTSVAVGTGLDDEVERRFVVGGAPETSDPDGGGYVRVTEVDRASGGHFASTGSGLNQTIVGGPGELHFGYAVHGVDLRDCYAPGGAGPERVACGQELLVGAPSLDLTSNKGRLFYYERGHDILGTFDRIATFTVPAAGPRGFGFAITSVTPRPPSNTPWVVAPAKAEFVAVSAPLDPLDERVFIYSVDPAASTPLVYEGQISVPSVSGFLGGKGFGKSLAAGFFDDDALPDLAVGMPDNNAAFIGGFVQGKIAVYRGVSVSSGVPFDLANPLVIDAEEVTGLGFLYASGSPVADEFGAAMAAGRIHADQNQDGLVDDPIVRDGLVVGAPGFDADDGAFCDILFDLNPAGRLVQDARRCFVSPAWASAYGFMVGGRFGASVAVGNFIAEDQDGNQFTPASIVEEVAIGAPESSSVAFPLTSAQGVVLVHLAGLQGPEAGQIATPQFDPSVSGAPVQSRYGSALGSVLAQDTPWEDLIVGAPTRPAPTGGIAGLYDVSRASSLSSPACNDVNGLFEAVDDEGTPRTIRIFTNDGENLTGIQFVSGYSLGMFRSSDGALCQREGDDTDGDGENDPVDAFYFIPPGTTHRLAAKYTCAATCVDQSFPGEPIGPLLEQILIAEGVWDGLSGVERAVIRAFQADIALQYQPAGSACNSGLDDRVSLGFVPGGTALGVLRGTDNFLVSDCEFNTPHELTVESRQVCE
jgi:hypothetical protein